jgi:hypothetical protein
VTGGLAAAVDRRAAGLFGRDDATDRRTGAAVEEVAPAVAGGGAAVGTGWGAGGTVTVGAVTGGVVTVGAEIGGTVTVGTVIRGTVIRGTVTGGTVTGGMVTSAVMRLWIT